MHLWPSITWVFSATESPFSFKILNSHTTMHGEALRGRLYLFIGTKANFSFPSSLLNCPLMLMGFIWASWEEAGEWFSIHMLQFTQYLLGGSAETLKPRASFYLCPWLKCSLGWHYLRYISSQIERQGNERNEVSEDISLSDVNNFFKTNNFC